MPSRATSIALIVGLWFALAFSTSTGEVIAAVAVSLGALACYARIRHGTDEIGAPRIRWVWQALRAWPRTILSDAAIVFRAVPGAPHRRGAFRRVALPPETPAALTWSIVGTSISPNTYVVAYDDESHELLVHELVGRPDEDVLWWPR